MVTQIWQTAKMPKKSQQSYTKANRRIHAYTAHLIVHMRPSANVNTGGDNYSKILEKLKLVSHK